MAEDKSPEQTLTDHPVSELINWLNKEAETQNTEGLPEELEGIVLTLRSAVYDFEDSDKDGKYWAQTSVHNKLAKEIVTEWEKKNPPPKTEADDISTLTGKPDLTVPVTEDQLPKIFRLEIVDIKNPSRYHIDQLLPVLTGIEKKKKEKLSDYVKRIGGKDALVEVSDTDEKRELIFERVPILVGKLADPSSLSASGRVTVIKYEKDGEKKTGVSRIEANVDIDLETIAEWLELKRQSSNQSKQK